VARRVAAETRDDQVTEHAAALTYYAVLSLFPALIALVSVVGLVGDPDATTNAIVDVVDELGPDSAADTFSGPVEEITANRARAGTLLVVGLATAIWTASAYVGAFTRAANAIYEVEEGRPFWKLRPLQLAITLTMVLLFALVLLTLVITGPLAEAVGSAIGLGDTAVEAWGIAKWPVLILVVSTMIAGLYYLTPNIRMPRFHVLTAGSVLAVAVWAAASAIFALYVSNFGSYERVYGTLGGIVTFLVWMWIANIAILLGVEVNAEVERERQLEAGVAGAEQSIQLPPRQAAEP
jgi:membrane protein